MTDVRGQQTMRYGSSLRSRGVAALRSLSQASAALGRPQMPSSASIANGRGSGDRARPRDEVRGRAGAPAAWCAIVLAQEGRDAEFRALALEAGGNRRIIARSESFHVPRSSDPVEGSVPRREHNSLVKYLESLGWEEIATRGRWHDTGLVRRAAEPSATTRDDPTDRPRDSHRQRRPHTLAAPEHEQRADGREAGPAGDERAVIGQSSARQRAQSPGAPDGEDPAAVTPPANAEPSPPDDDAPTPAGPAEETEPRATRSKGRGGRSGRGAGSRHGPGSSKRAKPDQPDGTPSNGQPAGPSRAASRKGNARSKSPIRKTVTERPAPGQLPHRGIPPLTD